MWVSLTLDNSEIRFRHTKSREWKYAFPGLSPTFHCPGLSLSGYSLLMTYRNIRSLGGICSDLSKRTLHPGQHLITGQIHTYVGGLVFIFFFSMSFLTQPFCPIHISSSLEDSAAVDLIFSILSVSFPGRHNSVLGYIWFRSWWNNVISFITCVTVSNKMGVIIFIVV